MSKTVVIAGAGVMGASLSQVYGLAGYETYVYDVIPAGLEKGRHLVDLNQATMVREGLVTQADSDAMHQKIHFTLEKDCFHRCDLVVECIVERMDVKHSFWREISAIVPPEALLATNTSGLHITEIAEAVEKPERFMGQHWLNPPHLIPMCEIIAGDKTSPEYIEEMRQLVKDLGKCPVVVKDINGFVSNRLQFALLREALYIVESGAATFEDVDTVLKAGMGLRYAALGAFGVADFGGLDTFNHINSYLNADLCNATEGHPLLQEKVDAGHLGVKSGQGFYDYAGDKADEAIRQRDKLYIDLAKVLYFDK